MLKTRLKRTLIFIFCFSTCIKAAEEEERKDPALGKRNRPIIPFSAAYPLDLPSLINVVVYKSRHRDIATVKNKTGSGLNIALDPDGEDLQPGGSKAFANHGQVQDAVEKAKPIQAGRAFFSGGSQRGSYLGGQSSYKRPTANRKPTYQNWYYKRQHRTQGNLKIGGRAMLSDDEDENEEIGKALAKAKTGRKVSAAKRRKGWSKSGTAGRHFEEGSNGEVEAEETETSTPEGAGEGGETGGEEEVAGGQGEEVEDSDETLLLPVFTNGTLRCVQEEEEGEVDLSKDDWKWKKIHIWVPDGQGYEKMDNLEEAVRQFREELLPCIEFNISYEAKGDPKPEGEHLYLEPNEKRGTCSSIVGKVHPEGQRLGLSSECIEHSVLLIQHELMHALGWSHEQRRMDRNEYVDVLWYNVKPHEAKELEIKESALTGGPYDVNSIMHFTQNWTEASMGGVIFEAKHKMNGTVGPIDSLSDIDKFKLRNVYCPNEGEFCGKKVKLTVPGWKKAGFQMDGGRSEAVPCMKDNDLALVIDSSTSWTIETYNMALKFAAKFAKTWRENPGNGVTLNTFATVGETPIPLTHSMTPEEIHEAILAVPWLQGKIRVDLGVEEARKALAGSDRKETTKNMVVFTDGVTDDQDLLLASLAEVKKKKQRVFVVAMGAVAGGGTTQEKLKKISLGHKDHVFYVEKVGEKGLMNILRDISLRVCAPDSSKSKPEA